VPSPTLRQVSIRWLLFAFLLIPGHLLAQRQTVLATIPIRVSAHYVLLSWTESETVDGFNLYRSVFPGGPYTKINPGLIPTTTFQDNTVLSGYTYYYVATAVRGEMESSYSNQVQAAIPNP
jgi:fibronectin type 3 domain-containing protein